jgi:uncharacterized protein
MEQNFIGSGWPLVVRRNGGIKAVEDEACVVFQAIRMILGTAPGERVMRPAFGCEIHDFVFALNSAGTTSRIETLVRQALIQWEPRIDVLRVTAAGDQDDSTIIRIEVEFVVRATNSRFNRVFPFYLE